MNKDQFLALLSQQQSSGLTTNQFCQEHSISVSTFDYWKRKLNLTKPRVAKPSSTSELIPMQIQHCVPSSTRVGGMVIQLPNGVQLEFARSDDKIALQTLTSLCNRYV